MPMVMGPGMSPANQNKVKETVNEGTKALLRFPMMRPPLPGSTFPVSRGWPGASGSEKKMC